ncbi:MAG: hypothetical protein ACE5J5_09180 [Candidatus Hydrothermarchaeales archaeon]
MEREKLWYLGFLGFLGLLGFYSVGLFGFFGFFAFFSIPKSEKAKMGNLEIIHMPLKKIMVLEVIPLKTPEDLATQLAPMISAGQPVVLSWANGVTFLSSPLPPTTDKLMNKYLEGVIYWSGVHYALMPEYMPVVKVELETGGTLEVGVMDVSQNQVFNDVGSWLKGLGGA